MFTFCDPLSNFRRTRGATSSFECLEHRAEVGDKLRTFENGHVSGAGGDSAFADFEGEAVTYFHAVGGDIFAGAATDAE